MRSEKGRSRKPLSVPMDSVSDIAFLLIIFFILTTSIRRVTGFQSELPAAQRDQQQTTEKMPSVKLHNGALTYNDEAVTPAQLRERLLQLKLPQRTESERVIVLEATGQVSYQDYFAVMAAVSQAGGAISIISESKDGGS